MAQLRGPMDMIFDLQQHNAFDHDYVKDERRCPSCRLRAEAKSTIAALPPTWWCCCSRLVVCRWCPKHGRFSA